ncbi:MAG: circadian clock protein KaiC [Ferruginibacter sp.]
MLIFHKKNSSTNFPKALTGIEGLDVITNGGIPKNRPTLLLGNTGCGKTILAMEFLVNGITAFDEHAVFLSFEERTSELEMNVRSLGFDLNKHLADNKIYLEYIPINRETARETGKYDIEGLFVRLEQAIKKVNAKRVVLDSLDTLFYGFDYKILRAEFKRLLSWLKDKNVTAIITGEIGNAFHTRDGVEEYVADCVIILDNRVVNQITTRRLRIVKYRGSIHGNNEYPFLINEKGITVLPVITDALQQKSSSKRILSGIADLDIMLDKKGFFIGSSVLVSGTAGTGKTSMAAAFAHSACNNDYRCLFCAFEEAPNQIIRNMRSIGIALEPIIKSGHLNFYYARPTLQNLELHFIAIKKMINELKPSVVVLDPITNLMTEGPNSDIRSMLTRFVDYLKIEQITVMFTAAITVGSIARNPSDEGISSMVDTWMMVQDIEVDSKRTRSLCIMKSRGMNHSNEVQRFNITKKGINLLPMEITDTTLAGEAKRTKQERLNILAPQQSIDLK